MSFSYDPELGTPQDQMRLMIGDNDPDDVQFQDEELAALLTIYNNNVFTTAKYAVRILIARYARNVDKWVGNLKILASQRVDAYTKLLEALENQEATDLSSAGYPTAGGVYVSDKISQAANKSLVKPFFWRDQFPYVGEE